MQHFYTVFEGILFIAYPLIYLILCLFLPFLESVAFHFCQANGRQILTIYKTLYLQNEKATPFNFSL